MLMKWFKRFLVVLMLLVLLATTTVYLTPLDVYVPEVEQSLSSNFKEPVRIQHLKLGALPLPHLELEQVQLGAKPDATLRSVRIYFDIHSLFEPQHVIERMVIDQGTTTKQQLAGLAAWLRSTDSSASLFRVRELQFNGIEVITPQVLLGPLEGQVKLAEDSTLLQAWISMDDQKVAVLIYPAPQGTYRVEAGLRSWSPPRFPSMVIDRMNISGILQGQQFNASKLTAEMLGVRLAGSGSLTWHPDWNLSIHLDEVDGDVERLVPLWKEGVVTNGKLHAQGDLQAQGADVHALQDSLSFDGDVSVQNATLRLPLKAQRPLQVDAFRSHVSGTKQEFKFEQLAASLYGGKLQGSAIVQVPTATLNSQVTFANLDAQPLVEALSDEVLLTGKLSGQAKFSTRMKEFEHFPANVLLSGSFRMSHGLLGKVDLVQAAKNPLKQGRKGGQTRFDNLSGLLSVDGNGYHLEKLKISSSGLNATGKLDVSPQLQLRGVLDTSLIPLVVSGTVREPLLRPSGSTLAGAAVGTALLGPGIGTAIGIKIGGLLNKLFGTTKHENQKPAGQNSPADQKK